MTTSLNTSCCEDEREPNTLSIEEALQYIKTQLPSFTDIEKVGLQDGLGRILAHSILSPLNLPPHDCAAMDGYALAGQTLSTTQQYRVIGSAFAGKPFLGTVQEGECVRIMTGAVLPEGTDTVVMQEHVTCLEEIIQLGTDEHPRQHVRYKGEDLAQGQVALQAGKPLLAAELGLLASLGFVEITVKRRLRIAFFSTGDELTAPTSALERGHIYDSNRTTLYAMLKRLGVEPLDMGIIPDELSTLQHALRMASGQAEVILTSGGVSVGEADFVKQALSDLGNIHFWKLAIKPGRPLAFGKIQDSLFFGLPGNPVAAMVAFYQLVQPALQTMMGIKINIPTWKVRCTSKLAKKPGRTEFQRGLLSQTENGEWTVCSTGAQGSGMLRSMSEGNCFIILPQEQGRVQINDWVTVQPFWGLI